MRRTRTAGTVKDLLHARPAEMRGGHNADNALTGDVKDSGAVLEVTAEAPPCPPDSGRVQKKHGLWPEDVARMRTAQEGKCYLCNGPLPASGYMLAIDHDHRCCPYRQSCAYCRRGLACHSCNLLIGHAHDDPQLLRRIADNLEAAIADVTRRLESKPTQVDLYEPGDLTAFRQAGARRKKATPKRGRPKADETRPERGPVQGGRDVLDDALAVFGDAKGLHWQDLAVRLAERYPDRWSGVTKSVISALIRATGVPGINIRNPSSRGGRVLWGCRRADIEAVIAGRAFWVGW